MQYSYKNKKKRKRLLRPLAFIKYKYNIMNSTVKEYSVSANNIPQLPSILHSAIILVGS